MARFLAQTDELSFPRNEPHIIERFENGSLAKITPWNPYENDGDAYRLAIDVCMRVEMNTQHGYTSAMNDYACFQEQHPDSNRYEATRLAIISVAIETAKKKFKE